MLTLVGIGFLVLLSAIIWAAQTYGDRDEHGKMKPGVGETDFNEWMVDVGLRKSATQGRVAVPEDDEEEGDAKENVK